MKIIPFLDAEHANVLVMLCYEDISFISETEGLRCRRIVKLKKEALLCLRAACGEVYKRDILVDPFHALNYMSIRCRLNIKNITLKIDHYIAEYMDRCESEYWGKIPKKGKLLTAAELLSFLYANYDCELPLLPYGFIF